MKSSRRISPDFENDQKNCRCVSIEAYNNSYWDKENNFSYKLIGSDLGVLDGGDLGGSVLGVFSYGVDVESQFHTRDHFLKELRIKQLIYNAIAL